MGPGPQRLISDMGFCGAHIQAPMNERWLERETVSRDQERHATTLSNIYFNKYRKTHFDYKTWNSVQYMKCTLRSLYTLRSALRYCTPHCKQVTNLFHLSHQDLSAEPCISSTRVHQWFVTPANRIRDGLSIAELGTRNYCCDNPVCFNATTFLPVALPLNMG